MPLFKSIWLKRCISFFSERDFSYSKSR